MQKTFGIPKKVSMAFPTVVYPSLPPTRIYLAPHLVKCSPSGHLTNSLGMVQAKPSTSGYRAEIFRPTSPRQDDRGVIYHPSSVVCLQHKANPSMDPRHHQETQNVEGLSKDKQEQLALSIQDRQHGVPQHLSPFELRLSHVPQPCAYIRLPWEIDKCYCRLLPLNKRSSEMVSPYDLIVRRMFVERISRSPSAFAIRYVYIPSLHSLSCPLMTFNHEALEVPQIAWEKREEEKSHQLFSLSQFIFKAHQILGLDCLQPTQCFSYTLGNDHHDGDSPPSFHSVFLVYLRVQLNELPFSRVQLEQDWYPRLSQLRCDVQSIVVVVDFRAVGSSPTVETLWSPECMRRIVHLTAQIHSLLDTCLMNTLAARNLCIIHLPPLSFSTFLDECIEKAHEKLHVSFPVKISTLDLSSLSHMNPRPELSLSTNVPRSTLLHPTSSTVNTTCLPTSTTVSFPCVSTTLCDGHVANFSSPIWQPSLQVRLEFVNGFSRTKDSLPSKSWHYKRNTTVSVVLVPQVTTPGLIDNSVQDKHPLRHWAKDSKDPKKEFFKGATRKILCDESSDYSEKVTGISRRLSRLKNSPRDVLQSAWKNQEKTVESEPYIAHPRRVLNPSRETTFESFWNLTTESTTPRCVPPSQYIDPKETLYISTKSPTFPPFFTPEFFCTCLDPTLSDPNSAIHTLDYYD